jgi:hypothetical protein
MAIDTTLPSGVKFHMTNCKPTTIFKEGTDASGAIRRVSRGGDAPTSSPQLFSIKQT